MTKSMQVGDGSHLDPLHWARTAMLSKSLHEARAEIKEQLEHHIHVNSLLISVGRWNPDPSDGGRVSHVAFQESAGVLVNREWTEFLNAGNFVHDPMVKRLYAPHGSLFWWENSPIHGSLNEEERLFARHYFEHDIRLGIVDGSTLGFTLWKLLPSIPGHHFVSLMSSGECKEIGYSSR